MYPTETHVSRCSLLLTCYGDQIGLPNRGPPFPITLTRAHISSQREVLEVSGAGFHQFASALVKERNKSPSGFSQTLSTTHL